MTEDQEEQEPSVLAYARFYQLATDHLSINPLGTEYLPSTTTRDTDTNAHITDLFPLPAPTIQQREKLSADKHVAALLSSIIRPPPPPPEEEVSLLLPDHKRVQQLKMDSPVLRGSFSSCAGDPELDMRAFRRRMETDLEVLRMNIPFEGIDERKGEGLAWSDVELGLPRLFWGRVKGEKLVAPREAAGLLQDVLRGWSGGDVEEGEEEQGRGKKKIKSWEPVTPPLLPLTPPATPFVPPPSVGHLEPLSDGASPTAEELKAIEEYLMKEDAIVCSKNPGEGGELDQAVSQSRKELEDFYSPLRSMGESSSSPIRNPVPAYRRKVEGPLTPQDVIVPPDKTVSLKDLVTDIPTPIDDSEDHLSTEAELGAFCQGTIKPLADGGNRELGQEQLQEADATKRVDVPLMNFPVPTPPWKTYLRESGSYRGSRDDFSRQMRLTGDLAEIHLKNSYWIGAKRVERELRWSPFPSEMGRVVTLEGIGDDDDDGNGKVENFVVGSGSKDEIDNGSLVWKPEGLRVLKTLKEEEEAEDDDLQPGIFRDGKDMRSLVTKRKLQLDDEQGDLMDDRRGKDGAGLNDSKKADKLDAQPLLGDVFSATKALKSFMHLRGHDTKRMKLMRSEHFACRASNERKIEEEPKPTHAVEPTFNPPVRPKRVLPAPTITPPSTQRPFVVSSAFLSQRRLSRRVEQLFPTAELIERDFGPEPTSARKPSASMYRSDIPSEADIILSPGTGLIWTTLQRIKQRPLPGQPSTSQNSVRERIQRIHLRYERLVVLISEAAEADTEPNELDEGDCTALTELMGFAASLGEDAVVEIRYIPGGEDELAHWIVACMIQHAVPEEQNVKLLQEETGWELFLRRSGLNAYAAQVVLGELKASPLTNGLASGLEHGRGYEYDHGLAALVKMSVEERVRRYEGVLGGRRMLIRASEAIDERWQ